MGLFFDVLSSINNPDQQGSVAQLESITKTVQQLAGSQGIDATEMQSVLSSVGSMLAPALQQQASGLPGGGNLGGLINQIAGSGASATALQSLFPPQVQQQLIAGIAQKTGLDAGMIQGMLPTLLPTVMGLLNMGSGKAGGPNPLLASFLGGGNDLGEVFKFANRFLNPA